MRPTTEGRLRTSNSVQIFSYFGTLTLLVYLVMPHGYLLDIATSYMLKNQLHASATQVSTFRLLTAIPVYASILFGLARDEWNPCGLKDRGFLLLFALVSTVVYIWMAYTPLSYANLFTGMLLVMVSFRFVTAAYQGLMALVGQEKLMSGRLSALWNIVNSIPYIVGGFAAGWIAIHVRPGATFVLMAALALAIALLALWKPRSVFNRTYDQPLAK